MKISKNSKVIICASQRGYTVNAQGDVYFKDRKRSLFPDGSGYLTFTIRITIKNKDIFRRVWVHRLQAYQKYKKEIFKKNIQVRHINGNHTDNSYTNIAIGTPSQNAMDKPAHIRKEMAINASNKIRKFDDTIMKILNEEHKNGVSYNKLSKKYKIAKSTLSYFFNTAHYNTGK